MHFFLLFAIVCSSLSAVSAIENTVHWQWRDLICSSKDGKGTDKISETPADCKIALRESEKDTEQRLPNGDVGAGGCFDVGPKQSTLSSFHSSVFQELVNGTVRTYCDLLCPGADTVWFSEFI